MKKMILLLVLPLTTLMAIDFTMTRDGLIAPSSTEDTATSGTSAYLEPVNLPKCDASNPEVQFIRSNDDWSMINSSSKRIFCVSPGDYRLKGQINITADGTAENRRYIILNNGNDQHPGKLDHDQLANFAFNLNDADYWVIDRAASFDVSYTHVNIIGNGSTYNIINRLYMTNTNSPMRVRDNAHYNTIQNCRFDGMSFKGYADDISAIIMTDWDSLPDTTDIYGTKIINNEFVNIKAIKLANKQDRIANFNGTIIDSNINYYDTAIRANSSGRLDTDGNYMITEGAMVGIKGGSNNEAEPIIVSNNIMWGVRKAKNGYYDNDLGNVGSFVTAYYGAYYIHIYNNVIFDSTDGIVIADKGNILKYGTYKAQIHDNIIVNCGDRFGYSNNAASLRLSSAQAMNVHDNLVKDSAGHWARVFYNYSDNSFGNNIAVNAVKTLEYTGNSVDSINTNSIYDTAVEAGYTEDFTFITDNFTNTPRTITLKDVIKPN